MRGVNFQCKKGVNIQCKSILIERRHDCSSTIFCTQFKKDEWHARLGGGVHADAMMDRIVHNAIWVFSGTLNMRKYLANVNNPFES